MRLQVSFIKKCLKLALIIRVQVSQMWLTREGIIWTKWPKLHENHKISIFGSKQWGI